MPEQKTKPTTKPVSDHIAEIADETRRADCERLVALHEEIMGESPTMWGPSIIGFGSYHYRYASGHEGDAPRAGFAAGTREMSVYLMTDYPTKQALLSRLGKHRNGKSCLYIKRLSDVDMDVLRTLIVDSVAAVDALYPPTDRS